MPGSPVTPDRDESKSVSTDFIRQVKARDPAGWQKLVLRFTTLIQAVCRDRRVQDNDIDDVCQDVFVAVDRHIGEFRPDLPKSTFTGWVRKIASNAIWNLHRRRRGASQAIGGSTALSAAGRIPAPDDRASESSLSAPCAATPCLAPSNRAASPHAAVVERVRNRVSEQSWEIMRRLIQDGANPNDVANELGLTVGAVWSVRSRVLRRLREELEKEQVSGAL